MMACAEIGRRGKQVKSLLIGALFFVIGCGTLPTEAELANFVDAHRQDLDEPAAMLQADFDPNSILNVSRTAINVLPGRHSDIG